MSFDNSVRQRKPQAGPLAHRLGRKERLENPVDVLRCDSLASIADFNAHLVVAMKAGANRNGALPFNGMAGIDQQVHENLVELRYQAEHMLSLIHI